MFRPEPPQGFSGSQQLVTIGRPPIPLFASPQGIGISQLLTSMAYPINWLNLDYLQRIPLTINAGKVPSTQTDFPLSINDTYPELVGFSANELRFAGVDNIQLEYEIESFDSGTGELVAWCKKPSVSDGDVVSIYFDNPLSVDEQNSAAVWADYNAVYHLNQTSFGALSTLDSTNNEDGTPQNMDGTNQVAGQIDGSLIFDGVNEVIVMSNNTILDPVTGGWTVSAWIRPDSDARMNILGKQRINNPFDGWSFRFSNSGNDRKLFVIMRDVVDVLSVRGTIQISLGVLHHVVFTYDGSGNASGVRIFIDGIEDIVNIETDTLVGGVSTDVVFNIADLGDITSGALLWKGIIDEVNILNTEKTPDFITTVSNNQSNPSTFYSTGTVESVPPFIQMGYPFASTIMGYPE